MHAGCTIQCSSQFVSVHPRRLVWTVWTLYGHCVGNVWELCGHCMDTVRTLHVRAMHGNCVVILWTLYGHCVVELAL